MGLDWSGSPVPWLLLAIITGGVLFSYWRGSHSATVGLLFLAGAISSVTVPLAGSNLRLEMVAVIALGVIVLARERAAVLSSAMAFRVPLALAALYLSAHIASSSLFAPDRLESLKIALWLGISILAAFVAAHLARQARTNRLNLGPWIVATAVLQVCVGLAAVASQALYGTTWGVMARDAVLGKVIGLSWEANILSINLAMALPFLIWVPREWRIGGRSRAILVAVLAIGLGLAYSRGGILAIATAGATVVAIHLWRHRADVASIRRDLLLPGVQVVAVVLVALGTMRALDVAGAAIADARNTAIISNDPRQVDEDGDEPTGAGEYRFVGAGDTLSVRLRHMEIAVKEVVASPIIGLGTDSYRHEHIEPTCACPAFINNLTVATLYEAGVIGLVALSGLIAYIVVAAIRKDAFAYAAAIVAMVVGYQFTDAIRFESNWILMGVAFGMYPYRTGGRLARSRGANVPEEAPEGTDSPPAVR